MARVFPVDLHEDTPRSERKVFERFRDRLPRSWTVLHSRRFLLPAAPRQRPVEGELDFLVLVPERGLLGLEVKGGDLRRDRGGWSSVDRYGKRHRIKDPGRQAQRAVHAIGRYLQQVPWFVENHLRPAFGWGVVFPDVKAARSLGPALPRSLVIDRDDLKSPEDAILRALDAQEVSGPALTALARREVIQALAPKLRLARTLGDRVADERDALVGLTAEQLEILDTLSEVRRVAVAGGAGSGKTVLAMERARRLSSNGARTLLLCRSESVATVLGTRAEGFEVATFTDIASRLARHAFGDWKEPKLAAALDAFWQHDAPLKLAKALEGEPEWRWDAVIVDEAQWLAAAWWPAIVRMLRNEETSYLWVFHDPHQSPHPPDWIEAQRLVPAALNWNCRNTRRIAEYAAALIGVAPHVNKGAPLGVPVVEVGCSSESAMVQTVRRQLQRLTGQGGLRPDQIAILSPRGTRSPVWSRRDLGEFSLVRPPACPGPRQVVFSGISEFSGLESDAVVLCDVREGRPDSDPRELYVGTACARHVLVVARYGKRKARR